MPAIKQSVCFNPCTACGLSPRELVAAAVRSWLQVAVERNTRGDAPIRSRCRKNRLSKSAMLPPKKPRYSCISSMTIYCRLCRNSPHCSR